MCQINPPYSYVIKQNVDDLGRQSDKYGYSTLYITQPSTNLLDGLFVSFQRASFAFVVGVCGTPGVLRAHLGDVVQRHAALGGVQSLSLTSGLNIGAWG